MFKEWLELRKYPIVTTGTSFTLLRIKYLWLAIRHPRRNYRRNLSDTQLLHGEVWNNFNKWLTFQVRFIHQTKWANSPIIRAVTLVNTSNFEQSDLSRISPEIIVLIEKTVDKYLENFDGIEAQEFRNWLTRNYLLCETFAENGINPILDDGTLLEIGPGLGGVLSMAAFANTKRIYSLDTAQMQEVFSALRNDFHSELDRIIMIPVNTFDQIDLPDHESRIENIVAFWSFTELKLEDRGKYLNLFKKAQRVYVACNEHFEGINNFDYIEELGEQLSMSVKSKSLQQIFNTPLPRYQQKHRIYLLERRA